MIIIGLVIIVMITTTVILNVKLIKLCQILGNL